MIMLPVLLCPRCFYELRVADVGRCSECGHPFERASVEAFWRERELAPGTVGSMVLWPPLATLLGLAFAALYLDPHLLLPACVAVGGGLVSNCVLANTLEYARIRRQATGERSLNYIRILARILVITALQVALMVLVVWLMALLIAAR